MMNGMDSAIQIRVLEGPGAVGDGRSGESTESDRHFIEIINLFLDFAWYRSRSSGEELDLLVMGSASAAPGGNRMSVI